MPYICDFCKKPHENIDSYLDCVNRCGYKLKEKERLEKESVAKKERDARKAALDEARKKYSDAVSAYAKDYPDDVISIFLGPKVTVDIRGDLFNEETIRQFNDLVNGSFFSKWV